MVLPDNTTGTWSMVHEIRIRANQAGSNVTSDGAVHEVMAWSGALCVRIVAGNRRSRACRLRRGSRYHPLVIEICTIIMVLCNCVMCARRYYTISESVDTDISGRWGQGLPVLFIVGEAVGFADVRCLVGHGIRHSIVCWSIYGVSYECSLSIAASASWRNAV